MRQRRHLRKSRVEGGIRVLLVEDDEFVRELVVAQLTELGHAVLPAPDGEAALRAVDAGEPVDLLMTDVMLPGPLDGYALAARVQTLRPGLPVLYATGGSAAAPGGTAATACRHLQKPFRLQQLARVLDELLASVPRR
jgi:CheY-like chemotaxis protein